METKKSSHWVGGAEYLIDMMSNDRDISIFLEDHPTWEPWQIQFYELILKPDSIAVDVGANVGINSISMSHFAPSGIIFAFEPIKDTYELLQANLSQNNIQNVETFAIAASNRSEEGLMRIDARGLGKSHKINKDTPVLHEGDRTTEVQFKRLDDLIPADFGGRVDLVKIDVEGFEEEVLGGASQIYESNPSAVWIIEFSSYGQDVRDNVARTSHSSLSLFSTLRSLFPNVFLITREQQLVEISSLAQLRAYLLFGYPVEDLLCCKSVSKNIAEFVISSSEFLRRNTDMVISPYAMKRVGGFSLNVDRDGWSLQRANHEEDVACAYYIAGNAESVTLKFTPVYSKHSQNGPLDVNIYTNNVGQSINIRDEYQELSIPIEKSGTWVYITTRSRLPASEYFGNPQDTRIIGFQSSLTDQ